MLLLVVVAKAIGRLHSISTICSVYSKKSYDI